MALADTPTPCCTPARDGSAELGDVQNIQAATSTDINAVIMPGTRGLIGTHSPAIALDSESPCREARFKPFAIMPTTVTNQMFANFVDQTGYVTEAEIFGWSFVFMHNVSERADDSRGASEAAWWRRVDGSYWRLVNGPGSENDWHPDHPVVHVSWNDARAFAKWAGGRLPTEAEWEHAARGGLGDVPFPWGTQPPNDTDFQPCNIWQGTFPHKNTTLDGYAATAPAQSFEPNGYGLYNMCGNVWEWTAEPFKVRSKTKQAREHAAAMKGRKLLKGGSFLCHNSYCFRYRIPARTGTTPDTTTSHQGFRLVFSV